MLEYVGNIFVLFFSSLQEFLWDISIVSAFRLDHLNEAQIFDKMTPDQKY